MAKARKTAPKTVKKNRNRPCPEINKKQFLRKLDLLQYVRCENLESGSPRRSNSYSKINETSVLETNPNKLKCQASMPTTTTGPQITPKSMTIFFRTASWPSCCTHGPPRWSRGVKMVPQGSRGAKMVPHGANKFVPHGAHGGPMVLQPATAAPSLHQYKKRAFPHLRSPLDADLATSSSNHC